MWRVMLCRPGSTWCQIVEVEVLPAVVERPVSFRTGLFAQRFRVTHVDQHGNASADYEGLRRIPELARQFDPARLPGLNP